jgi:hypothetical protein
MPFASVTQDVDLHLANSPTVHQCKHHGIYRSKIHDSRLVHSSSRAIAACKQIHLCLLHLYKLLSHDGVALAHESHRIRILVICTLKLTRQDGASAFEEPLIGRGFIVSLDVLSEFQEQEHTRSTTRTATVYYVAVSIDLRDVSLDNLQARSADGAP